MNFFLHFFANTDVKLHREKYHFNTKFGGKAARNKFDPFSVVFTPQWALIQRLSTAPVVI